MTPLGFLLVRAIGTMLAVSQVALVPSMLQFRAPVREVSTVQYLTVTNQGNATVKVNTVSTSNKAFTVQMDSCSGKYLEPGRNCTVGVIFHAPAKVSTTSADLTILTTP